MIENFLSLWTTDILLATATMQVLPTIPLAPGAQAPWPSSHALFTSVHPNCSVGSQFLSVPSSQKPDQPFRLAPSSGLTAPCSSFPALLTVCH